MKITIEKELNIEELLDDYKDIISGDENTDFIVSPYELEILNSVGMALEYYWNKYGD